MSRPLPEKQIMSGERTTTIRPLIAPQLLLWHSPKPSGRLVAAIIDACICGFHALRWRVQKTINKPGNRRHCQQGHAENGPHHDHQTKPDHRTDFRSSHRRYLIYISHLPG